jgi:hypothetical protein
MYLSACKHDTRVTDRDRDRIMYRYQTMLDIIDLVELTDNVATGVAYYFRAQIARATNKNIESVLCALRSKHNCMLRDHIPYLQQMIKMLRDRMNIIIDRYQGNLRVPIKCDVFMQSCINMGLDMLIRVLTHHMRDGVVFDIMSDSLTTSKHYDRLMNEMYIESTESSSDDVDKNEASYCAYVDI